MKQIEGVENVDNQIEVLPLSTMDDGLRLRLYRAIYGFPSLEKYAMPVIKPIRIIVKNGHVTLEGVVDNQADKDLAGLRANGVSGVFSVTNNLVVVKEKVDASPAGVELLAHFRAARVLLFRFFLHPSYNRFYS